MRCRFVPTIATLIVAALFLTGCTVSNSAGEISSDGGVATLPGDTAARLIVPPGAVTGTVQVSLTEDDQVPPPYTGTTQIGPVIDITTSGPIVGGRVVLPLDVGEVGPSGRRDFFIGLYSEPLRIWIPLPTDWDGTSASAIAPHFSRFGKFSYDIPVVSDVDDAVAWAGDKAGGFAHDTYGGVKNFAGGIADGVSSLGEGGELKAPDCGRPQGGWTVRSSASEVTGCVVDDEGLRLRIGNTYRVPFSLAGPPGTSIGLTSSDYQLGLIDAMMRVLNGGAGLAYVAPRGTTSIGIPPSQVGEGSKFSVSVAPDHLGTAVHVIASVLSFLPGKKKLTEEIDDQLMVTMWEVRGSTTSISQLLVEWRTRVTRDVGSSDELEALKRYFDAVTCAFESLQGGVASADQRDAGETAEEIVDVAKECAGRALEAADSAMKEVWKFFKGTLDTIQALRQTADAIKLGLTHFGGEVEMTVERAAPITLGVPWRGRAQGFGEVQPNYIDLGGASSTGVVSDVTWSSWGEPTAEGTGEAAYVPPDASNSEAVRERATVIAFDPGICQGERVYQRLTWFFPQHGEYFDPDVAFDACETL